MIPETEGNKIIARCFDMLTSFLETAGELQRAFESKRVSLEAPGAILCFLLAKSLTAAEAVRVLCEKGYSKDALILVRPVYEAALWVLDIFREPDLVSEKAIAFIRDEPLDRKKMLAKMMALVPEKSGDRSKPETEESDGKQVSAEQATARQREEAFRQKLREELERAEQDLSKIDTEHKITHSLRNYGRKKLEQLAQDSGLLHMHYAFYWHSSLYTHNRPRSSLSFMADKQNGWQFMWGPDSRQIDDVLIYLCHFLWYLLDKFNVYFQLSQDRVIAEKWQQLEELMSLVSKKD